MMERQPKGWMVTKLSAVADWGSGGTPSRNNPAFFSGKIPWIKTGELGEKYIHSVEEYISEEAIQNSSAKIFPKGSVGIAMYGATIGRLSIWRVDASTNQACAVAQPYDGILFNEYLYYFLLSEKWSFIKAGKGGAQPNISQSILKDWLIPLAPLNEQKRIVAKIEELFSELDKGIENLKTAREQLKAYRQAVLKHAFNDFSERIALEEISEAVGGYAFKSPSFQEVVGKYQVIRMGNLRPGFIRENESPVFLNEVDAKILDRYLLKEGDVLITLTGTRNKRDYGYTAIVKKGNYLINQRIAYLRFTKEYIPEFFLYYSWTEDFKRQFFGHETGNVGQGNVGMKAIRTTLLPKVDIAEQRELISTLDANFAVVENLEITIDSELQKSKALRQSILKKAFSGQLVAQDLNDEPASVLLERIRAEKERSQEANTELKNVRRKRA